jgi:hypothetical protein
MGTLLQPKVRRELLLLYMGLALSLLARLAVPAAFANDNPISQDQCAEAFALIDNFTFPKGENFSFQEQSRKNINAYRMKLGAYSTDETELEESLRELKLTVSTRRSAKDLMKAANSEGILPRKILSNRGIPSFTRYKAPSEEDLFGASDWSYAIFKWAL